MDATANVLASLNIDAESAEDELESHMSHLYLDSDDEMVALTGMLTTNEDATTSKIDQSTQAELFRPGRSDLMILPTWADFMQLNGICLFLPYAKFNIGPSQTGLKRHFEVTGTGEMRRNEIKTCTSHQLKADLLARGLSRAGLKEELINRLIEADCETCDEGIALLNIPEAAEVHITPDEWLNPPASRELTMAEYRCMAMIEPHERPGYKDREEGSRPISRLLHPLPTGRLKHNDKKGRLQKSLVPEGTMDWVSIWNVKLARKVNKRPAEYSNHWCRNCGLKMGPSVRIKLCLACEKVGYCSDECEKAACGDHQHDCKASQKLENERRCRLMDIESKMLLSDAEACNLADKWWRDLAVEEGLQITEEQRLNYARRDQRFEKTQYLGYISAGLDRDLILTLKAFDLSGDLAKLLSESANWSLQQSLEFIASVHSLVEHKLRLGEYGLPLGGPRIDHCGRLVAAAMGAVRQGNARVENTASCRPASASIPVQDLQTLTVSPSMDAIDYVQENVTTKILVESTELLGLNEAHEAAVRSHDMVQEEEKGHLLAELTNGGYRKWRPPPTTLADHDPEGARTQSEITSKGETECDNDWESSWGHKDIWGELSSQASDASIDSGSAVECPRVRPHSPRRRLASELEDEDDWRLGGTALVNHGFGPSKSANLPKPKYTWISESDLETYNGTNGQEKLYIAIKGIVFDISKSRSGWFQPGSPWHAMTGKDASCALAAMSPEPESNLEPYYKHLGPEDQQNLSGWFDYFGYRYPVVGRVLWKEERLVGSTHGYDGQALPIYEGNEDVADVHQADEARSQWRGWQEVAPSGSDSDCTSTDSSTGDSCSVSDKQINDLPMTREQSISDSLDVNGCRNNSNIRDENLTPVRRDEEWNSDWTDSVDATDEGGPAGAHCECKCCVTNWKTKWGQHNDIDMSKSHALDKNGYEEADRNIERNSYQCSYKAAEQAVNESLSRAEKRAAAIFAWLEEQSTYGSGVNDLDR